ncbi:MAG TPA: dockerin type I repeat-containing protein, partial [Methanocorpusculum sp.]|nr:dockerin type I repeat-containing protein [Methanocorpusculum sp.]
VLIPVVPSSSVSYYSNFVSTAYVGGIAGALDYIENCYSIGEIAIQSSIDNVTVFAGGLAGLSPRVKNSYAAEKIIISGNISSSYIGGIVGSTGDVYEIVNSVALNDIVAPQAVNNISRVAGRISGSGTLRNYAWNELLINNVISKENIGEDTLNGASVTYQTISNGNYFFKDVLGWDFNAVWKMNSGNPNYKLPIFQWQTVPFTKNASYLKKTNRDKTASDSTAETEASQLVSTSISSLPSLKIPQYTNPKSGKSIPLDDDVAVKAVISGVEQTLPAKIIDGQVVLDDPEAAAGADSLTVEFIGRKLGDSDGDGQVTVNDAVKVAQSLVSIVELNEKGEFYGDADSDGDVTVNDAVKVAQRLVGLVDENYE